jgi:hypothetical protein
MRRRCIRAGSGLASRSDIEISDVRSGRVIVRHIGRRVDPPGHAAADGRVDRARRSVWGRLEVESGWARAYVARG